MKKNFLTTFCMMIAVAFFTSGCMKNDINITFDEKDNMTVETTLVMPPNLLAYLEDEDGGVSDMNGFASAMNGVNVFVDSQQISDGNLTGYRRIEEFKKISKAENVQAISWLIPQVEGDDVLDVADYLLFKNYSLFGKIVEPDNMKSRNDSSQEFTTNDILSTTLRIKVPTTAIVKNVNTDVRDVNDEKIFVWNIDYNQENYVCLEFCVINWLIVLYLVSTVIIAVGYCVFAYSKKAIQNAQTKEK